MGLYHNILHQGLNQWVTVTKQSGPICMHQCLPLVGQHHVSQRQFHVVLYSCTYIQGEGGLICKWRGLFFLIFLWQYGYHCCWSHMNCKRAQSPPPPTHTQRAYILSRLTLKYSIHKIVCVCRCVCRVCGCVRGFCMCEGDFVCVWVRLCAWSDVPFRFPSCLAWLSCNMPYLDWGAPPSHLLGDWVECTGSAVSWFHFSQPFPL